jgi:hypothetical protein
MAKHRDKSGAGAAQHGQAAAATLAPARKSAAGTALGWQLLGATVTFALGWASRHFAAASPPPPPPPPPPAEPPVEAHAREDPWARTTHPDMGTEGFNWSQLSMSRAGNFPPKGYKEYNVSQLREHGAMWAWHTTYARSIPAVVTGLAQELADAHAGWTLADYRRAWGDLEVVVAFSPDIYFQRGRVDDPARGRRLRAPHRQRMRFSEFADMQEAYGKEEYIAINQSPSRDFGEFGFPAFPPLLEELVGPTLNARNFWAAHCPKTSALHYDWQDSVLLQVAGSKRFTILDPARLHTAYPAVFKQDQLVRVGPGEFEVKETDREIDNFPLVNVTHPDLARHPLFRDAHVITIDVPARSALFLPAYWYHQVEHSISIAHESRSHPYAMLCYQVESFAEPSGLNVAINYWFQGHSLATRLYRTLRENLFINCSVPSPPGQPDVCRNSDLGA